MTAGAFREMQMGQGWGMSLDRLEGYLPNVRAR
jgi:hypothetical protein